MTQTKTQTELKSTEAPTQGSVSTIRKHPSWIDQFCEYTDGITSPEIFRRWAAVGAIAAALERKVWSVPTESKLYPNLIVFLVGRPGVGKSQALAQMLDLVRSVQEIKVSPDDSTKAALVDFFADATTRKRITYPWGLYEYHSVLACAHELGILIKEHDLEMLSFISSLYDCPDTHEERRRSRKDEPLLRIPHPSLTFIAGTTPGYLSSLFPEVAWSQGFMARTICVYSADVVRPEFFTTRKTNPNLKTGLISDLHQISKLEGEYHWTDKAKELLVGWYKDGARPVPSHSRLANYNTRRMLQLFKLCMIFSASRTNELIVEEPDVQAALDLLISTEAFMPEIFLEMSSNSDANIIQELHGYCQVISIRTKKPVSNARVTHFLSTRVPAWRIKGIIEVCEDTKILIKSKTNPDCWEPSKAMQTGGNFDD